jgi:hypothetical protein
MEISVPIMIDVSPKLEALLERLIDALISSAGGLPPPASTHVAPCAPAGETGHQSTVSSGSPLVDATQSASITRGGIVRWSINRDAVLYEGWEIGTPTHILEAKINALPGAIVPRDRIPIRASALGLKRPSLPAGARQASQSTRTQPVVDGIQQADVDAVRTWAAPRGLPFDQIADLERINAKRCQHGLRPFSLSHVPARWR